MRRLDMASYDSFATRTRGKLMSRIIVLAAVIGFVSSCASAADGTLLPQGVGYPRLVRLTYGPTASNGWIIAATTGKLFQSKDDGRSFVFLGDAPARDGSRVRCCEALYELPQAVGSLSEGTLIYSATYSERITPPQPETAAVSRQRVPRQEEDTAIEIYTSTDRGAHWVYHSTPVAGRGEKGSGGLWEPEFTVARDGALVMFWSDETFSCCSQKLSKIRTFDGVTWKDSSDVVASTTPSDRPGMIIVRRLPTGVYFMSYEICGDPLTGPKCAAYYRISRDGWSYGTASYLGRRIETETGQFFEHAPASIWSPSPVSPNGVILLIGQVLHNADGSIAKENGRVLFMNPLLDGSGPWTPIAVPVQVPISYDNPCPNYSSALLPVQDGSALLEFASDFYALNKCGMYFGIKPWKDLLRTTDTQDGGTKKK
jgi:hypothetical protein